MLLLLCDFACSAYDVFACNKINVSIIIIIITIVMIIFNLSNV